MSGLEQFHFLRPWWLLGFIPLLWLLLHESHAIGGLMLQRKH